MPKNSLGTWQVRVTGQEQAVGIPAFSSPKSPQYLIRKAELFWLLSLRSDYPGTSLMAQWLRLHDPNAGGPGTIPGQGTRYHTHAAMKKPANRN